MSATQRAARAARPFPILDAWHRRDVLWGNEQVRDAVMHEAQVRLIADDAWSWYLADHQHRNGVSLDLSELGCCAPPYPAMWIEGATDLDVFNRLNGREARSTITRCGVMLAWYDRDEWMDNGDDDTRRSLAGMMWDEMAPPGTRWIVGATSAALFGTDTVPRFAPAPAVVMLDDEGRATSWTVLGSGGGPEDGEVATGVYGTAAFGMMLGLVAVQFLHARNVKTVERTAPELRRGKKSTRGNLPAYRYHVLDVTGLRTAYAAAGGDPLDPAAAKAAIGMHTVRGHFKTYTPDAPLLGRHVGRYFWHDHVRGSTPDRVVEKAYHPTPQEGP